MRNDISTKGTKQLLSQGKITLLDVRRDDELEISFIKEAVHIPMEDLPSCFQELPKSRSIVVFCRSGGRSAACAKFLREKGYDAKNMVGGINEWAKVIGPSLQQY